MRWKFFVILLLALALRLLLWAQPLHQLANDEVEYVRVAHDLLAGHGWSFYDQYHWLRAPLYPLFLAASLWLAGGDLHLAALPNLVLSVINVGLVAALSTTLAGRRAGLLAAAIMALLWTNATFASLYMLETLFTFLFSSALLLLLQQRLTLRHAILSGLLFGLAALTRSAVLPFLALIFFLMLWQGLRKKQITSATQGSQHNRDSTQTQAKINDSVRNQPSMPEARLLPLVWLLSIVLVITPWTLRNTQAYGRPILIETGLSYNLWAFNEPRQSLDQIEAILDKMPNPAERSDYATAQGMQRLREDPLILARKIWPNWVFLARVKPIQDRFLQESYYSSIDLPLFSATLIFDDLLYVLIVLAAIWGLGSGEGETENTKHETGDRMSQPSQESRGQTEALQETKHPSAHLMQYVSLTWAFVMIVTILLTHGEARYRHFLFPVLIPYAAVVLLRRKEKSKGRGDQTNTQLDEGQDTKVKALPMTTRYRLFKLLQYLALTTLSLIFLWTVLSSYPHQWASQNLERGWHTLLGDIARSMGRPEAAMTSYQQASNAQRAADPRLRLGDTARAQGDLARALKAYQSAQRISPLYEASAAKLGDLLRAQADDKAARAAFNAAYLDQQRMLDWSWRELRPQARSFIDIGAGLDYGYISGVYPAEEQQGSTFRWTQAHTLLRLHNPAATQLSLRLSAPRPDNSLVPVAICINSGCTTVVASAQWRVIHIQLLAHPSGTVIELRSPTFRASDQRRLGVMLDWLKMP